MRLFKRRAPWELDKKKGPTLPKKEAFKCDLSVKARELLKEDPRPSLKDAAARLLIFWTEQGYKGAGLNMVVKAELINMGCYSGDEIKLWQANK